jgi:hypothetical protein
MGSSLGYGFTEMLLIFATAEIVLLKKPELERGKGRLCSATLAMLAMWVKVASLWSVKVNRGRRHKGVWRGTCWLFTVLGLLYNGVGLFLQVQLQKEGGWQGSITETTRPKCTLRVGKKESGSMTEVVGPGRPSFFFVRRRRLAYLPLSFVQPLKSDHSRTDPNPNSNPACCSAVVSGPTNLR